MSDWLNNASTFEAAIDWAKQRKVVLPDDYYGNRIGIARAQAFSVAGLASLDQLEAVKTALDGYLANGKPFSNFVNDVKDGVVPLDLPKGRLDNIFRTNIQGAYNTGRYAAQQEFKDSRPYLMYDAINDSRTRPAHKAMDNIIKPIDDPFWDANYPPNGYRCRCHVRSLSTAQAEAKGGTTVNIPSSAKSDTGWDYNGGKARGEGIKRAIAQRLENCPDVLGFAKRVRNDACKLAQYDEVKNILLAINELSRRNHSMPPVQELNPSILLPEGISHEVAVSRFLSEFKSDGIVNLTGKIKLQITDDFFVKQSGASKAEGKDRARFMRVFARAIKQPQEAWLSLDDGSKRVFLTLLSRYKIGKDLVGVFAKMELKENGYYRGITVFNSDEVNYVEENRNGTLIRIKGD